jgi:hypothetical protein
MIAVCRRPRAVTVGPAMVMNDPWIGREREGPSQQQTRVVQVPVPASTSTVTRGLAMGPTYQVPGSDEETLPN